MCWSESSHSKFWKHLGEAKTMSSELLSIKLSERGQLLWWWRDLALPEQNWHMGNVAIKLSMLSSSQFPKTNRSSKQTWYNSWAGKHVVQNDIIVNYIAYSHHDTRDSDWFWLSPQMVEQSTGLKNEAFIPAVSLPQSKEKGYPHLLTRNKVRATSRESSASTFCLN